MATDLPLILFLLGFTAVPALAFSYRLDLIQRRVAMLHRLESKLDLLLQHADIKYDPMNALPQGVIDALNAGEKIKAIKLYREINGIGLKEAKDFIEMAQRRLGS